MTKVTFPKAVVCYETLKRFRLSSAKPSPWSSASSPPSSSWSPSSSICLLIIASFIERWCGRLSVGRIRVSSSQTWDNHRQSRVAIWTRRGGRGIIRKYQNVKLPEIHYSSHKILKFQRLVRVLTNIESEKELPHIFLASPQIRISPT